MDNKIIAVVKYPYQKPETITLDKGLKPLQEIVGGALTGADLPGIDDVFGYCNDEGLLIGLEPNIYRPQYKDALVGPIVFVGAGDEGDDKSLTPSQIKKVTEYLNTNSVADFGEFVLNIQSNFTNYKHKKQAEM